MDTMAMMKPHDVTDLQEVVEADAVAGDDEARAKARAEGVRAAQRVARAVHHVEVRRAAVPARTIRTPGTVTWAQIP